MALLLPAAWLVPAQDLVDIALDGLQLLDALLLFPVAVVKAVFLDDKLLNRSSRCPVRPVGQS